MVVAGQLTACTSMMMWERGLPKRVEVHRLAGPATTRVVVERTGPTRLEIAVLQRRSIELGRRVVYNSIQHRGEWQPSAIAWELFEMPFGAAVVVLSPFLYAVGMLDFPDEPTVKRATWRNRAAFVFGFVNPAQSIIGAKYVSDPNVDDELFFSPVARTRYRVSVPRRDVLVRYWVGTAAGAVQREGEARTDELGRVELRGIGAGPLWVEVTAEGRKIHLGIAPHNALQ